MALFKNPNKSAYICGKKHWSDVVICKLDTIFVKNDAKLGTYYSKK